MAAVISLFTAIDMLEFLWMRQNRMPANVFQPLDQLPSAAGFQPAGLSGTTPDGGVQARRLRTRECVGGRQPDGVPQRSRQFGGLHHKTSQSAVIRHRAVLVVRHEQQPERAFVRLAVPSV